LNEELAQVRYASATLKLKVDPERLRIYHQEQLIAEHVRSYDRHQDFEHPDHAEPLLLQRRQAKEQQLLVRFLALGNAASRGACLGKAVARLICSTSRRESA